MVNKRRGEQTVVNKRRGEQTVVMVNKLGEHRVHLWVQLWATEKLVDTLVNTLVSTACEQLRLELHT